MLEALELRRMLSVTVDFQPKLGMLTVTGSDKPDVIEVRLEDVQDGKQVGTSVLVLDQGQIVYKGFDAPGTFAVVQVYGAYGDDTLIMTNSGAPVRTFLYGDDGADELIATNAYGAPGTEVFGGAGNDVIMLHADKGATVGHRAFGDGGDDLILGSELGDWLYGDSNVKEPAKFGNDTIFAGEGNDLLFGAEGDDLLCGEGGDDYLEGGLGSDLVDGGAGFDAALIDLFDKVIDIERMTLGGAAKILSPTTGRVA